MVDPFDAQSLSRGGALEPHVVEGPFDLPARALRSGDNVLAVEVHQSTSASVDVVFGGELIADVSQCGIGLEVVRLAAGEARLDWPDPTYHLQSAPALNGPWTTDPDATSGVHVRIDTGNRYFRLAK